MYDNEYGMGDMLNVDAPANEINDTYAGAARTTETLAEPELVTPTASDANISMPQTSGTSYIDPYSRPVTRRPYTDYVGYQNSSESGTAVSSNRNRAVPVSNGGGGTTPPSGGGYYPGNVPEPNAKKPKKKKGKAGFVVAIIAVLLAGLLIGGGLTYFFVLGPGTVHKIEGDTIQEFDATGDINAEESVDDENSTADSETSSDIGLNNIEDADKTSATTDTSDVTIGTTTDDTVPVIENETNALSVAQIAEKCLPSVVAITNIGETEVRSMWGNFTQQSESAGSGIIIGQSDSELLILTNYHVVANNTTLSVVFSWEEGDDNADKAEIINAVIKDYDSNRDVAVIAIKLSDLSADTISQIALATVGSSDDLVLGEQVVAIGNALGYGQSVTTGIVSALNREVETDTINGSGRVTNTFIQTDAAINPGNSGGALFNMQGELVGINSAKIGGGTVEGMGYAIPISEIMDDVEKMMNQETRIAVAEEDRGYLGVSIVDVTSDISETYNLPQGAYISSINPGSGAENAGLQKEDIITGVNGKDITSSSELKDYLSYYAAGDTVTLTIARKSDDGYDTLDVEVTLSAADELQSENTVDPAPGGNGGQGGQQMGPDMSIYDDLFGFGFPFGFGG